MGCVCEPSGSNERFSQDNLENRGIVHEPSLDNMRVERESEHLELMIQFQTVIASVRMEKYNRVLSASSDKLTVQREA